MKSFGYPIHYTALHKFLLPENQPFLHEGWTYYRAQHMRLRTQQHVFDAIEAEPIPEPAYDLFPPDDDKGWKPIEFIDRILNKYPARSTDECGTTIPGPTVEIGAHHTIVHKGLLQLASRLPNAHMFIGPAPAPGCLFIRFTKGQMFMLPAPASWRVNKPALRFYTTQPDRI